LGKKLRVLAHCSIQARRLTGKRSKLIEHKAR
jgi:hypothetical protein